MLHVVPDVTEIRIFAVFEVVGHVRSVNGAILKAIWRCLDLLQYGKKTTEVRSTQSHRSKVIDNDFLGGFCLDFVQESMGRFNWASLLRDVKNWDPFKVIPRYCIGHPYCAEFTRDKRARSNKMAAFFSMLPGLRQR